VEGGGGEEGGGGGEGGEEGEGVSLGGERAEAGVRNGLFAGDGEKVVTESCGVANGGLEERNAQFVPRPSPVRTPAASEVTRGWEMNFEGSDIWDREIHRGSPFGFTPLVNGTTRPFHRIFEIVKRRG